MQGDERPDQVAYNFYGDSGLDWVVLTQIILFMSEMNGLWEIKIFLDLYKWKIHKSRNIKYSSLRN